MLKLRAMAERLRGGLWFVPTLIVFAFALLAVVMIELGQVSDRTHLIARFPRLFGAGADASRGLLSTIAGSMITVAGVSFSITVVALALASSQYTSRIVGNFMRDRANQAVLGVFLGIFAYCLVILRTIRSGDDGLYVPSLAVLVGMLLAFVAIGFLIFFIHHIAASIQAANIVASTSAETVLAVDRLFPAGVGEPVENDHQGLQRLAARIELWHAVAATHTGYIQDVDPDVLLTVARETDTVLRMDLGIGDFVIAGSPLLSAADRALSDRDVARLRAAYGIGKQRTLRQDAAYGIRQLVDMALRALSPGINDTTTAIHCIDYLGAILARLVDRQMEPPFRSDGGALRVITRGATFEKFLDEAFDQIRHSAPGNVVVLMRMLSVLSVLSMRAEARPRREALGRHVERIAAAGEKHLDTAFEREQLFEAAVAIRTTLKSTNED